MLATLRTIAAVATAGPLRSPCMMVLDGPVAYEVGDFFNDVEHVAKFGGTSDPERRCLTESTFATLAMTRSIGSSSWARSTSSCCATERSRRSCRTASRPMTPRTRWASTIFESQRLPDATRISSGFSIPARFESGVSTSLPLTTRRSPALRLIDAPAFGTGLHPTTALCLEALDEALAIVRPQSVLDVGTGSGVLALAALRLGVPRGLAIDIDDEAVRVAAENAHTNGLGDRLLLARGGPETPHRCVAARARQRAGGAADRHGAGPRAARGPSWSPGALGHPSSVEPDVDRAYRHLGMRRVRPRSRAGWVALEMRATW